MGYFGRFVYSGGRWGAEIEEPCIVIDIHDSDIAGVYLAAEGHTELFYLGTQPREYFDDPEASEELDVDAEANQFAALANRHFGAHITAEQVRPFLAEEGVEPRDDFVEETVADLLELLGLPLPDDLPRPP